jgi:hypothetical protein
MSEKSKTIFFLGRREYVFLFLLFFLPPHGEQMNARSVMSCEEATPYIARVMHCTCTKHARAIDVVTTYVYEWWVLFFFVLEISVPYVLDVSSRSQTLPPNSTMQKEDSHHIKISAHAWSTKCKWNKKLIAYFCCTLRDERFEPN